MDTTAIILTVVGAILGSSVISSVVTGLFMRVKTRAEAGKTNADAAKTATDSQLSLQEFWHVEFKRLDERIADLEEIVKGRDVTIAELKKENTELKRKIAESEAEIVQLTSRIRELERLIEQYNIQVDCGDDHEQ
jgi:peptidoglycan hydrolase CwlO-like protein